MSAILKQEKAESIAVKKEVESKEVFIIISSRDLEPEEQKILNTHGKLFIFDKTIFVLSIPEIEKEKQFDYLYFNIDNQEDRGYLSLHFDEIDKYKIVILKKYSDEYSEKWITQFDAFKPVIIKFIPSFVKKTELIHFLSSYRKVHKPIGKLQKLGNFLGRCL